MSDRRLPLLMDGPLIETQRILKDVVTMVLFAVVCLIIALTAAAFAFGGIAGSFVGVAKIILAVFLVLAVVSFLGREFRGGDLPG